MAHPVSRLLSALLFAVLPTAVFADDVIDSAATHGGAKAFVAAVKAAGLDASLRENGPYTVFAPEDAAFDKLPPETRDSLMKDKNKLAQVLAYHVIPGKMTVSEVKLGDVQTMQGGTVKIKSDNGKVTVNEANVTQSDVEADNGVVHIVDTVVLPKE